MKRQQKHKVPFVYRPDVSRITLNCSELFSIMSDVPPFLTIFNLFDNKAKIKNPYLCSRTWIFAHPRVQYIYYAENDIIVLYKHSNQVINLFINNLKTNQL